MSYRTAGDFDDIMDLLGPGVGQATPTDYGPRPSAPTITDTTGGANLWLPTSVAFHYREYDRAGGAVDELTEQIAQQGILTPLRISTDGEYAVVHEGNHRLQAAQRLGISEVPVIVTFDSPVVSNGGRVAQLEPVLQSWIAQNRGSLRSFWGRNIPLSRTITAADPSGDRWETESLGGMTVTASRRNAGRPLNFPFTSEEETYRDLAMDAMEDPDDEDEFRDLMAFYESEYGLSFRPEAFELYDDGTWMEDREAATLSQTITAAEPGGVLPWTPSQNGYYWIAKNDDSLEAVTNDGINRMRLYEKPWGWEWVVRDDLGVVESGNFGSALKGGDALRDRADDLLAEFDTNPLRRTRGPSRGYQDDYTQAPNELWGRREALHHEPSNEGGVAVVLTFPMEWNEHLAAPDGTPADQLHVTLGYFGGLEDMDDESEEDLRAVCAVVAAMNPAFVATLGGLIRFSGEEQDAFVLSVDATEVEQVRQDFLKELSWVDLDPDRSHGFTPHCTLGYLDQDEPLPFDRWVPIDVPVVNLELWYGGQRHVYPLGLNAEKLARKLNTSERYAERLRREGRR